MLFTLLLELIEHTSELILVQTIYLPIEQSMIDFVFDLFHCIMKCLLFIDTEIKIIFYFSFCIECICLLVYTIGHW